jgi:hypothetical protein
MYVLLSIHVALGSHSIVVRPPQVSSDESERLIKMEETLHQRVIGQEEAVVAISRAIRRARVGLKNPNRPIASFIFSGPTGVGKSELAKTLASYYFGSEEAMVRTISLLPVLCMLYVFCVAYGLQQSIVFNFAVSARGRYRPEQKGYLHSLVWKPEHNNSKTWPSTYTRRNGMFGYAWGKKSKAF